MFKLLTEAEVAERLCCSKQTVRRLRLAHKITYLPGKQPLYDEVDLQAFIDRRRALAESAKPKAPPPPTESEQLAIARHLARIHHRRRRLTEELRQHAQEEEAAKPRRRRRRRRRRRPK